MNQKLFMAAKITFYCVVLYCTVLYCTCECLARPRPRLLLGVGVVGLGAYTAHWVARACEDGLVQRVRPGEDQNLKIFSPNVKCWVPLL